MSAEIVALPLPVRPDADCRMTDDGQEFHLFRLGYELGATEYELEFWAADFEAAASVVQQMRDTVSLEGRVLSRGQPPLLERLAECLGEIVDAPLMVVGDPEGGERALELRLSSFSRDLAERAAALLEEAGR